VAAGGVAGLCRTCTTPRSPAQLLTSMLFGPPVLHRERLQSSHAWLGSRLGFNL
jgi:hypothetical protein